MGTGASPIAPPPGFVPENQEQQSATTTAPASPTPPPGFVPETQAAPTEEQGPIGRFLSAAGERAKQVLANPPQPKELITPGQRFQPGGQVQLGWTGGAPESHVTQRLTNGDIAGGLGEGLVEAGRVAAPLIAGGLVKAPETGMLRKGAVGPSEQFISRPQQIESLLNAINVPKEQVEPLRRSLTNEAGSVIDFAKRTGNDLHGLKDLSQAAKGAGEEGQRIFKLRVVDPIADETIPTPSAWKGPVRNPTGGQYGRGGEISIGDLNQRITFLNDTLRSNSQKGLEGQTREAQAMDAEMKAEVDALNPVLYQEIASRTNLNIDQVKEMRQHFGRLFDIADRTNFAANEKMRSMLNEIQGQQTSKSMSEAAFRLLNQARGGPLGVADRMMRSALPKIKMDPYNMPEVEHMNQPLTLSTAPVGGRFAGTGQTVEVKPPDYTPDVEAARQSRAQTASTRATARTAAEQRAFQQDLLEKWRGKLLREGAGPEADAEARERAARALGGEKKE